MKPPEFFADLRASVVELQRAGPLGAWYFAEAGSVEIDSDERVARLDELMTQAILGADITIAPGATAREVWVPLLVDYGKTAGKVMPTDRLEVFDPETKAKRDLIVGRGKPGKLMGDFSVTTSTSEETWTLIPDLLSLAADYLEHLKTKALAAYRTALGRNIDRLRKECGWSFTDLAVKTGFDRKLIIGHVHQGKGAQPSTIRAYATAFSRELKREVLPAELTD